MSGLGDAVGVVVGSSIVEVGVTVAVEAGVGASVSVAVAVGVSATVGVAVVVVVTAIVGVGVAVAVAVVSGDAVAVDVGVGVRVAVDVAAGVGCVAPLPVGSGVASILATGLDAGCGEGEGSLSGFIALSGTASVAAIDDSVIALLSSLWAGSSLFSSLLIGCISASVEGGCATGGLASCSG